MKIEGVIFDLDGVLWSSSRLHQTAFEEILTPLGISFSYEKIAGMRTRDALAMLLPEPHKEEQLRELAQRKSARALELLREANPILPGALDVLERIAIGHPIAVATSGSKPSLDAFVDTNRCRPLFRALIHEGDVVNAKPAPDLFLAASQRMGLPPEKCLVLEDAVSGVTAARIAGCPVAGVLTGSASADSLRQAGATTILDSITDLPALLGLNLQRRWTAQQITHPAHDPQQWTAIVPAAGRGTRLGYDQPKILFPVGGRPILDWLMDLLMDRCAQIILVVSPTGVEPVSAHLRARGWEHRVHLATQQEPLGMGHAVACGAELLKTPRCLIVWGDQAALRPTMLDAALALHSSADALATIPTLFRSRPYIHFERNISGQITHVRQAREGDTLPESGESDAGVFLLQSFALHRYLADTSGALECRGAVTGESNFLPLFPFMDRLAGNLLTAEIVHEEESVGVNSRQDAEHLSAALQARPATRSPQ